MRKPKTAAMSLDEFRKRMGDLIEYLHKSGVHSTGPVAMLLAASAEAVIGNDHSIPEKDRRLLMQLCAQVYTFFIASVQVRHDRSNAS